MAELPRCYEEGKRELGVTGADEVHLHSIPRTHALSSAVYVHHLALEAPDASSG